MCVCARNCYVCLFLHFVLSIVPGMFCELLELVESCLCSVNFPASMSFICDRFFVVAVAQSDGNNICLHILSVKVALQIFYYCL